MRKPRRPLAWPIAYHIKTLIIEQSFEYKALAQLSGLGERTIDKIVKGGMPVERRTLQRLASVLGVTIDEISRSTREEAEKAAASSGPRDAQPLAVINEADDRFSLSIREWMSRLNKEVTRLTKDQYRVITKLEDCDRARISGCAGSGKTLVAAEKAARCKIAGNSTLFLCHSPKLALYVRSLLHETGVRVENFGDWTLSVAKREPPSSGGIWTRYHEPDVALLDTARAALLSGGSRYNVIIVDEGQDFRKDWWDVVEAAMPESPRRGSLYIFHDDSQSILPGQPIYPVVDPVENLSRNCRNGGRIFEFVNMLYPDKLEPEGGLLHMGALRIFIFDATDRKAAIRQAIDWVLAEGFHGDIDAARGKIVALQGGATNPEESPLIGDYPARFSDWQTSVRNQFRRAFDLAVTLRVPVGGFTAVEDVLRALSQEHYPSADDIQIVQAAAGLFTIDPATRRKVTSRPGRNRTLAWIPDPEETSQSSKRRIFALTHGSAREGRPWLERSSEIILHFTERNWHEGLPLPEFISLVEGTDSVAPGIVPVYGVLEYKGLESGCVLLSLEGISSTIRQEFYIGASRARHLLAILIERGTSRALPAGLKSFM